MNGKHVLVTGGCGFIGINLTEKLLEMGAQVTVLDLPSANWDKISKSVRQIKADILEPDQLVGTIKKEEIIFHLAARTDIDGRSLSDYRINFVGTKNLIDEASKSKSIKRFVFYSTQLVVGIFNETRFIDENEPYRTKTYYGESKIEGELIVRKYCIKEGIPYTIIRPTSVYGPYGKEPYDEFFRTIKNRKYFHVGKAMNLVSMVYVKNLIDLTITTSLSDEAKNETYFGNDFHPYTMRELVDGVASYYKISIRTIPNIFITLVAYGFGILKILGLNPPIYPFRLRNIKANYCYDIQKSIDIGYRPKYELTEGLKETLDWYEDNGVFEKGK